MLKQRTTKHFLRSAFSLLLVVLMAVAVANFKTVSADGGAKQLSEDEASLLTMDVSGRQLTNLVEKSVPYAGDYSELTPMVQGTVYTVVYPDAILVPGSATPLTVKVDIEMTNTVGGTDNRVLVFGDPSSPLYGKTRVYWRNGPGVETKWTISLWKDSECTKPNYDFTVLTGLEDPDESDYRFNTAGRSIYYQQPESGNILDAYEFREGGEETGGWYLKNTAIGVDPGDYLNARFLVSMTDSFTFYTRTHLKGAISVPFFYLPCYTVKYDPNWPAASAEADRSGTMTDDKSRLFSTTYNLKENTFAVDGYKFLNWDTKADDTGIDFDDQDPYDDNSFGKVILPGGFAKVYAQWTPAYTVRYNANYKPDAADKAGTVADQTPVEYGESKNISTNSYTTSNYTFVGWNTKPDGSGTTFKENDPYKSSSFGLTDDPTLGEPGVVVDLYAMWEPFYTLHFDSNYKPDATGTTGTMADQTPLAYGKTQPLSDNQFAATNYKFVGWNTKADGTGTPFTDKQEFKSSDFALTDDPKEAVAGVTVNLFAQWEPFYTVHFEPNYKDDALDKTGTMTDQTPEEYGVTDNLNPNSFSTSNYQFVGWNTKADGTGTPFTDKQEFKSSSFGLTDDPKEAEADVTVTLYAQWELWKHKIHYDPNGGSGNMPTDVYTYKDATMYSKSNAFTRSGYRFVHFTYVDPVLGKQCYVNPYDFKDILEALGKGSEITLVAQWEAIPVQTHTYYIPVTGIN